MHSTNLSESVTASSLAADLTELLLQPRRIYLKKRESRSSYVVDIRKKLAAAIVRPFQMLLAVTFADLDDGLSLALVLQPYEAAIALIRVYAARRAPRNAIPFSVRITALMARETRAQATLDLAQLRVIADPLNLAACADARRAGCEYSVILAEMLALLDEQHATDQLVA